MRRLPALAARLRGRAARRRRARSRSPTSSRLERDGRRAVRHRDRRGVDHDRPRRRAHPGDPRGVEPAGRRSARAPPPAASRRCGTAPTSTDFVRPSTRRPEYIYDARDLDADRRPRPGRLRAARLPDQQAPAGRGDRGAPARAAGPACRATASASSASGARDVCVLVAHGIPCLGPVTQAGCGAICPAYDRDCFGCYGPKEPPNPSRSPAGDADALATGADRRPRARLLRDVQRCDQRSRRVKRGEPADRRTDVRPWPASRARGRCTCKLDGGRSSDVELHIYEPPRFFEAFLRGRAFSEAPDITARICGICPVAYQMSAVHAMEDVCGVTIPGQIRALRRLLYCGEWIESHALHVYLLHAPDFLGYDERHADGARPPGDRRARAAAQEDRQRRAGGARRPRDPPDQRRASAASTARRAVAELRTLVEPLERAREAALETVRWVAGFDFPERDVEYELVALAAGRVPDRGRPHRLRPAASTSRRSSTTSTSSRSTSSTRTRCTRAATTGPPTCAARWPATAALRPALAARARGRGRGGARPGVPQPLPEHRRAGRRAGRTRCEEALRIIDAYEPPDRPSVDVRRRAPAPATARTEAPRGLLYHRYRIDEDGMIRTPRSCRRRRRTSSRSRTTCAASSSAIASSTDDELRRVCEQAIRNYDPCISCATHFLTLDVDRG